LPNTPEPKPSDMSAPAEALSSAAESAAGVSTAAGVAKRMSSKSSVAPATG
jgi:hypothetical protein